jgi:hypothetical protein
VIAHQNTLLQERGGGGYDLVVSSTKAGAKPEAFLTSQYNEVQARLAPNGRWIAYASDESGRFEVYVRPFPKGAGQFPISNGGGMEPEWRRDGKELFYVSSDGKMMAVDVGTASPTFSAGVPHALFNVEILEAVGPYPTDYAVSNDGQRFLINTVVDQPTRPSLTVVLNWAANLK